MSEFDTPRSDVLIWAHGSDAPEKRVLNIGFMALSDSASVIVAATQGFAEKHGLSLCLQRQSSWAALRDRLISGELDAAHSLYGLIYGVQLGLDSGTPTDMAVLMGLNQNGQSINLSHALQQQGVISGEALARHTHQNQARLKFAQTFPTGTHAMWLYYWLASQGIHPLQDVDSIVVPPPQMIEHLKAQRIDGFCVGEPWTAKAVQDNLGCTLTTTQAIWPDHPEKVLGSTRGFVEQHPNTARALIMAILEASRFIDADEENRRSTAQLLSGSDYVDAPLSAILPRFLGHYQDGLGNAWQDAHRLRFHGDGTVNLPYLSDAMWFMTQFRRWGLLREDPDYFGVARQVQQLTLYRQAAEMLGIACPEPMRSCTLKDGPRWDGSDPVGYARSFALHAMTDQPALSA